MSNQGQSRLLGSEFVPFFGTKTAPLKGREPVPTSVLCLEASVVHVTVGEA